MCLFVINKWLHCCKKQLEYSSFSSDTIHNLETAVKVDIVKKRYICNHVLKFLPCKHVAYINQHTRPRENVKLSISINDCVTFIKCGRYLCCENGSRT